MRLRQPLGINLRRDRYLFVDAFSYRDGQFNRPGMPNYERLSPWDAAAVLRQLVHAPAHDIHTRRLVRVLAGTLPVDRRAQVFSQSPLSAPMPRDVEESLIKGLGRSRPDDPDGVARFATYHLLRAERPAAPPPPPDPQKERREAIEAAEKAPRGFVVVEVVDPTEAPIMNVRIELLLADGEVRTRFTNGEGVVHVDRIPQGQCHIRLPELDGSSWAPSAGAASTRVDRGRKRVHVMAKGENLTRIAHGAGIADWKKLWNAPENEELRKKRKNAHVLYVGDEIVIPGLDVHEILRPTDQTHRVIVKRPLLPFRVVLQDHNQLPYREQDYELTLTSDPDEQPRTGTTDSKGKLVEQLPAAARRVDVFLPKAKVRWTFHLDEFLPIPSEESIEDETDPATAELAVKALQMRLLGMGFPCGEVDGKLDAPTSAAVALWREEPNAPAPAPAETPPEDTEPKLDHGLLADVEDKYEVIA